MLKRKYHEIDPEDIFLDSENLPGFREYALEGRIEKPVGSRTFTVFKIILLLIILALTSKLWFLSIVKGEAYAEISEKNRLEETLLFANRGAILDRSGLEVAGNEIKSASSTFAARRYALMPGLSHLIGFIKYPQADKNGFFYEDFQARDGVERSYNEILKGVNGRKLVETDVAGAVTGESVVEMPEDGESLTLSIDAKITSELHKAIKDLSGRAEFVGGAGVIMDVNTGEVLALTSFPEYDHNGLTNGLSQKEFQVLLNNSKNPFLNRVVSGKYTPGSIIKPILALAALNEKIISPQKEIYSSGSITVPNPYDPLKPTIFKDWKAHGYTAMREALAVSSDTYFYSIGAGYGDQRGLGISLIDKYLESFGLEEPTGIKLLGEVKGLVPTPEWKKEKFNDIWRLGDTYITAIGQFGTQVTPIEVARAIAAVANRGKLLRPTLIKGEQGEMEILNFKEEDWQVVHEGMREGVKYGTSVGLNVPYVKAAAKTGTAEVGDKSHVHSWSVGFFPYEHPRYAWAVVMEKGPSTNTLGATSVVRQLFDWMATNAPEYFENGQ